VHGPRPGGVPLPRRRRRLALHALRVTHPPRTRCASVHPLRLPDPFSARDELKHNQLRRQLLHTTSTGGSRGIRRSRAASTARAPGRSR
jgi:hypothetical protein